MSFLRLLEEQGYRARADRRYLSGTVVDVDVLAHTCSVDVGATDVNGNPVYLTGIAFSPATPPAVGSQVNLLYGNSNPHSAVVAGSALGGGNPQSAITVVGAVTSLAAVGNPALQGAVNLAAGANVQLSESGQTITIAAPNAMTNPMTTAGDLIVGGTGGTPQRLPVGSNGQVLEVVNGVPAWANAPSAGTPASTVQPVGASNVVGTSTNYAREDHQHAGVHSLAASGNAGVTGDVVLAAGGGVTLTQSGQQITIAASGAGGSGAPANIIEVIAQGGATQVVAQGSILWMVVTGVGQVVLAPSAAQPILWVYNATAGTVSLLPGTGNTFASGNQMDNVGSGASAVYIALPNGSNWTLYRAI
ncbi:MAG TPA: hypothetical protein VKV29_11070 [Chthonomonas sp.]|uniref:hypothetical protein n=1 Tax=Chthonomonas sp. TaxID=2282153 RepID=UPI002B4B238E|nr:hypothetical protein [Chthonomonas sp.]HLH80806.1 hypothetical protein [Chthonomonas sp.]